MLVTIRRNKYGKLAYATKIDPAAGLVIGWSPDPAAAEPVEDAIAKKVTEAFEARGAGKLTGQIAVLDAAGKTLYLWGDPGEEPVAPKPAASLPGIAEELAELKQRVELIEEADAGGKDAAAVPQFTEDQVKDLLAIVATAKKEKWIKPIEVQAPAPSSPAA